MMDTARFDKRIQVIAKRLSNGDSFLAEELRSKMHIALADVFEQPESSDHILMALAENVAGIYLQDKAEVSR